MDTKLSADELSNLFQQAVRLELGKFAEEGLQNKLASFVDVVIGRLVSVKNVGFEPVDTVFNFTSGMSSGALSGAASEARQPTKIIHERIRPPRQDHISAELRADRLDWSKRHPRSFTMGLENEENYDHFVSLKVNVADSIKILDYEPDAAELEVISSNVSSVEIPIFPSTSTQQVQCKQNVSKLEEAKFHHPSRRQVGFEANAEDALRLGMTDRTRTSSELKQRQTFTYMVAVRIVTHPWFEKLVSIVILLNAVHIGWATDYMAQNGLTEQPVSLEVMECLFLMVFLGEILLRVYVFKLDIYRKRLASGRPNLGFHQNVIDTTVIGLQLIEKLFYYGRLQNISILSQMSVLRLLRLLKILRLVRVLRTLRCVQDLRMIVTSIWRSFSLFCWSLLALWFLTYLWSVYLTDLVRDDKMKRGSENLQSMQLDDYFGSMPKTMITLLWTITGGEDWRYVFEALTSMQQSGLAWVPLLVYIFFASLAMMNVITGVFLETAVEKARQEKEIFLVRNARMIFARADADKTGMISWPDFQNALSFSDVQNFFESIDIDHAEARSLFELLDITGDGKISADEFLNGCLRVRGPAKSLDLLVVSREIERLFDTFLTSTNHLQQALARNFAMAETPEALASNVARSETPDTVQ